MPVRIAKNGQLITSVDDWFRHAPPKGGADHWRDGRSAKELARAWIESGSVAVPDELSAPRRDSWGAHEVKARQMS